MLEPNNYLDVLQHIQSLTPGVSDGFMVDQQVLHRFAKLLKASGINYAKVLQTPATIHKDPEGVIVWGFQADHFPAPLATMRGSGDSKFVWIHGTTELGALGILKTGKVARSTVDGLDMPPGLETSGFFAKAMFGYLAEGTPYAHAKAVADFYYHGKNACNIVFSGEAFGQHIKPISADTHREQQLMQRYPVVHSCSKDKRRLIREDVARVTHIFLLSNPEDNWGLWQAKPGRSVADTGSSGAPTEVSQTNAGCCLHETDCVIDSEWLCSADMTLLLCKWLCSAYKRLCSPYM